MFADYREGLLGRGVLKVGFGVSSSWYNHLDLSVLEAGMMIVVLSVIL